MPTKILIYTCLLLANLVVLTAHASTKNRINNIESQYQLLEQRLLALESKLGNQAMLELVDTLQLIQTEMQQIQGDVEELHHELDGVRKRQRDLYLDIDRRLNDLSLNSILERQTDAQAATTSPAVETQASIAEPAQPAPRAEANVAVKPADKVTIKQQRAEYEAAFLLLRESRYSEAIIAYREFMQKHPASRYASNAQYWLGKLYYVTKAFDKAIIELNKVISNYPDSSKAADARLNLGYTYFELKDWTNARSMLESVVNDYPNASASSLAKKRLQRMTEAGH